MAHALPDFLTMIDITLLAFGALLIGLDKAGLRGVTILVVPLYASYFGGKPSASTVLPLLIIGDICAVIIYRKKIRLSYLRRMLPAALAGMAAGMWVGNRVPDRTFKLILAVVVLICLLLMIVKEFMARDLALPDHWAAHGTGGFLGGFTTMMGNAAGPIMSAYLLSLNLPKEIFIGTGAIFFFMVNLLKIPVHTMVWGSMTAETLKISAVFAPFVLVGLFIGLKIVRLIPERPFRIFIIAAALAGTLRLFFG